MLVDDDDSAYLDLKGYECVVLAKSYTYLKN